MLSRFRKGTQTLQFCISRSIKGTSEFKERQQPDKLCILGKSSGSKFLLERSWWALSPDKFLLSNRSSDGERSGDLETGNYRKELDRPDEIVISMMKSGKELRAIYFNDVCYHDTVFLRWNAVKAFSELIRL